DAWRRVAGVGGVPRHHRPGYAPVVGRSVPGPSRRRRRWLLARHERTNDVLTRGRGLAAVDDEARHGRAGRVARRGAQSLRPADGTRRLRRFAPAAPPPTPVAVLALGLGGPAAL